MFMPYAYREALTQNVIRPLGIYADMAGEFNRQVRSFWGPFLHPVADMALRNATGTLEMTSFLCRDFSKTDFGLTKTQIGEKSVDVKEEVALSLPFCDLVHFRRRTDRNDPRVLIVAPLSGHHATLLRETVEALLPAHDVYITDWRDASEVPLSDGKFDLETYTDYIGDFIRDLGPKTHVLAVCQSTVPVLAAVSLIAENEPGSQPLSLTLEAGPVDTRRASCEVTDLAEKHPLSLFRMLRDRVPGGYAGSGRDVYPGHTQLQSFMLMNPALHWRRLTDAWLAACDGSDDAKEKLFEFYEEYFTTLDLPWEFYEQTLTDVFMDQKLAKGTMSVRGQCVDPGMIDRTSLFTVEGGKDDISPPGQTVAAHGLLTGLPSFRKFHYLNEDCGHYGVFAGSRWRREIAPRITAFMRDAGEVRGIRYDPVPDNTLLKAPERWDGSVPKSRKPSAIACSSMPWLESAPQMIVG